jgi:hypothetical protein
MRELCVVATLVVTGWARQLRSHVHGALNVGCSAESVMVAVKEAGRVAGPWAYKWACDITRSEIAAARGGASETEMRISGAARRPPVAGAPPRRKTREMKPRGATRASRPRRGGSRSG